MLERFLYLLEMIDTDLLHGRPYQSAMALFICFTFPAPLRTLKVGKSRGGSQWGCRFSAFVQSLFLVVAVGILFRWSYMGQWGSDLYERADHHYILIISVCALSLALRFGFAESLLKGVVGIWLRCFPTRSIGLVNLAGRFTSNRAGFLRIFRPPAFFFSPRLGNVLDVGLMMAMTRAFRSKKCLVYVPVFLNARLVLSRLARIREPEFAFDWNRHGTGKQDSSGDHEAGSGAPRGGDLFPVRSGSDEDGAIDRECRWFAAALLACDRRDERSQEFSHYSDIFKVWQGHIEDLEEPENRFQDELKSYGRNNIENHLNLVRSIVDTDSSGELINIETWYFGLRDTFVKSDPKPDPIVRLSAVLLALHLFDQRFLTWSHSILEIYLVVDRVDDSEPSDPIRELAAWIYFRCLEDMLQALNLDVEETADLSYQTDENTAGQLADHATRLKSMWQLAMSDLPQGHEVSKGAK